MRVIIIQIRSGLGNQMFQYAFAKSLAHKTGAKLILDTRFFENPLPGTTPRNYELSAFHIEEEILSNELMDRMPDDIFLYEEHRRLIYDSKIAESIEYPCYLTGYWQSWKYFKSIEQMLRSEFIFREDKLSLEVRELGKMLSDTNSVSIHVRRTDYHIHSNFGILPLSYYYNAIKYIEYEIENPRFYIFSDDPEWVENYFDISGSFQVIKGYTGIEDLFLMSHCNHHIIANSSFSWWAGWLGSNLEKRVIAPSVWKLGDRINVTEIDLIPPEWVCLW